MIERILDGECGVVVVFVDVYLGEELGKNLDLVFGVDVVLGGFHFK